MEALGVFTDPSPGTPDSMHSLLSIDSKPCNVSDKGNIQNSYGQHCSELLHAGKKVWLLLDTYCHE